MAARIRVLFLVLTSLCVGIGIFPVQVQAQGVPGEDPVRIQTQIVIQMLPVPGAPRSGYIDPASGIPAWQKARIARYEAKAFSGNTGDILTERDVINTTHSDGFKTTCTQTIGSAPTAAGTGLQGVGSKPTQQVVVLRGDLVNICN